MTFPSAPLGIECDLNLGGWTNITPYTVQQNGAGVTITRGRQNETTTITPSTAQMKWNNRGAQFDPDNPVGPWYGLLGLNTPVRWSIPGSGAALRLEDDQVSYASTGAVSISGSLDARIDFQPSGYYPCVLFDLGGAAELFLNGDGSLTFNWADTSNVVHSASTSAVAGQVIPLGRVMVRVTLDVTTGTVTWYTAPSMAGSQTQLAQVTGGGATSLHANTGVRAGGPATGGAPFASTSVTGRIYEFRCYNGIAGTLLAGPQFYMQTPGVTSFSDGQGNTWTLQGSATIDSRAYRFHGEASNLPQEWDPSGSDVWVPCQAYGIMRRLQAGNKPVASAIKRAITSLSGSFIPAAYWPGEDGAGSTQIASGLPGGQPMMFTGAPGFQGTAGSPSVDTNFPCSAQLPQVGSSTWTGIVPGGGITWTDNVTRMLLYETAGTITSTTVLASVYSAGPVARLDLFYAPGSGGELGLTGYNAAGAQLFSTGGVTFAIDGDPCCVSMELQHGATITYQIVVIRAGASAQSFSGTIAGSVGAVTSVVTNPSAANLGATELGHIWVQGTFAGLGNLLQPLEAWNGEPAGMRFGRLCAENGINGRVYGFPATTAAMGPQTIDTLANLLQFCEDADRGQLFEPRQCLGMGYRTLASLQNQSPAATLAYNLGQVSPPMKPTRDDKLVRNDITLTRNNGSSYQYQATSGPNSIQDPPNGVGDYSTSLTVYCLADSQLLNIAPWMAWVGTVPGKRYPQITVDLASTDIGMQAILPAVRDTDIGDHVQVTGTPQPLLPPGTIDQLDVGSTEILGDFRWLMTWNCIPELPYEVAVAGASNTPGVAHAQTAGSQLAVAYSSSATSLLVNTLAGNQWTTAGGDFPFDIIVAGERITVTGIANTSGSVTSPGTFANVVFWSIAAGTYYVMWQVTLSGTLGSHEVNNFALYNGSTFVASSANPAVAGTWQQAPQVLTVTSGVPDLKILTGSATPTTGAVYAAAFLSPQTFTVTRSVNGVAKSQAAGAAVSLYNVPVAALAGVN